MCSNLVPRSSLDRHLDMEAKVLLFTFVLIIMAVCDLGLAVLFGIWLELCMYKIALFMAYSIVRKY